MSRRKIILWKKIFKNIQIAHKSKWIDNTLKSIFHKKNLTSYRKTANPYVLKRQHHLIWFL
jgi:hypothetical protein